MNPQGKLYLVSTPLGNLGDITYRAVEVLKSCSKILAEDTRTSKVLLDHYNIGTRLESFHQHNEHQKLNGILNEIKNGSVIAQISDAGTPGISDPGFLLARAAIENNLELEIIPGATAFIPALLLSGFALHKFVFEGFLPPKKGRQTRLKSISEQENTVVLYESPHKILKTLEQLEPLIHPERRLSISRELTKKFEETIRGNVKTLISHFQQNQPRGEFVVVLEGKNAKAEADTDAE